MGKGLILISSEEGETEENNEKFLSDFGLKEGSILTCDDFLQNYQLKVSGRCRVDAILAKLFFLNSEL